MTPDVVVAGATGWGTTMAMHIARGGPQVQLLVRDEKEARQLVELGRHPRLKQFEFPSALTVSADSTVLAAAPLLVMGVPAQTMRRNVKGIASSIGHQQSVTPSVRTSSWVGIGKTRSTAYRFGKVASNSAIAREPSGGYASRVVGRISSTTTTTGGGVVADADRGWGARLRVDPW